jgi:hypothetical protein
VRAMGQAALAVVVVAMDDSSTTEIGILVSR